MKIASIQAYPLILPVKEVYGGAAGFLEDCRSLIVCVRTANGIEGWGEATQGRPGNTYETLETMEVMVRGYFAPALKGMDLDDTGAVLRALHETRQGHPMAKAAVETALFDALGKFYRIPLYRLFGGPYRREVELVGGLGLELDPETIGAHARGLSEDGFHMFKIKLGSKDRKRDIERVRAVREAVGEEAKIRVDGNGCYSFSSAVALLTELKRYSIADAEQPLDRHDLKNLSELRRIVGIPIAAQESVSSPEDALSLLKEDGADLLKIKLTHIGGFQRGFQVAAVAGAGGLRVIVGQGSACTTILSAAEIHLHASMKNAGPGGEMTGFLRLGEQQIAGPIEVKAGRAVVPGGPGLGVQVNEEKIRALVPKS